MQCRGLFRVQVEEAGRSGVSDAVWRRSSDFPARLGSKAGSTAQLLVAFSLTLLEPGLLSMASEGLGPSRPVNHGFICFRLLRPTSHGLYVLEL
jgi:hypothetical protein